jgi:hypothetical protein
MKRSRNGLSPGLDETVSNAVSLDIFEPPESARKNGSCLQGLAIKMTHGS